MHVQLTLLSLLLVLVAVIMGSPIESEKQGHKLETSVEDVPYLADLGLRSNQNDDAFDYSQESEILPRQLDKRWANQVRFGKRASWASSVRFG